MANNLRDLLAMDTLEVMNPPAPPQGVSSMGSTLECFNNMHTGRETNFCSSEGWVGTGEEPMGMNTVDPRYTL